MYLAEVDEEVLRKNLMAEGYEDGFSAGNLQRLSMQIKKKILAGKPLEQIAAEVEENPEDIRKLYEELIAAEK